jgi:hypothetical protein
MYALAGFDLTIQEAPVDHAAIAILTHYLYRFKAVYEDQIVR